MRFTLLPGFYWSPVNAGTDDTLDSDVLAADNGATFYFGYTAGTAATNHDGGMVPI